MKKFLLVVVLIAVYAAPAFPQARPTLGVLPFTGGAGEDGEVIAGLFLNQRELRDAFNVVPRNMVLNTIFREQQFQLSDLTDPNTMVSINRMLNADYVLSGSITDVGGRNLLIISIIHVERFEQVAGLYITYGGLEEVIRLLPSVSSRLVGAALAPRTAGRPSLAVVPFAHRAGVNPNDAETLAQILAIEVLHTGRYTVVPRLSIMQAVLREQGFQMTGVTDDAGMASLGRALNSGFVLGGSITGLGAANLFMAQILSVQTGHVIEADTVQYTVISNGVELMGNLAINMAYPPGPQRDRLLIELGLRQNHLVPVPGANLAAQAEWLRTNAVNDTHYLIELSQDVTADRVSWSSDRSNVTVTLRGVGGMRTVSSSNNWFHLFSVQGLTLVLDENITLQGTSDGDPRSLVTVNDRGILINRGARIIGHSPERRYDIASSTERGAAINVMGTFIMLDGAIYGNRSRPPPSGSFGVSGAHNGVFNRGTFIMHGGMIYGNIGANGANGWDGTNASRRNTNGGNGSPGGSGGVGGVLNIGTFVMHGGTITGNRGGYGGRGGAGGSPGPGPGSGGRRGAAGSSGANGAGGIYSTGTLRITNGIVEGLTISGGSAQYGVYNSSGVFSQMGTLSSGNGTILVANGVLHR